MAVLQTRNTKTKRSLTKMKLRFNFSKQRTNLLKSRFNQVKSKKNFSKWSLLFFLLFFVKIDQLFSVKNLVPRE